jgi:DNA-binding GntR family transcriptional regulator
MRNALQDEMAPLQAGSHLTKTALAAQALRQAILRGDISADAPLTVGRIAQQLGMSQTPVREAMRTLQAEGLLQHQPHHSVSVMRYTAKDIHDIFQLRADLEAQATRIAVRQLSDADFADLDAGQREMREAAARNDIDRLNQLNSHWHLRIYGAADNQVLLDVVQHLWKKFMFEVNWLLPGHAERSLDQHATILAALRARDGKQAEALMREHIRAGEEASLRHLESSQLRPRA